MKINICPNFTFLPLAVTAVHASYLSQSVHVLLYRLFDYSINIGIYKDENLPRLDKKILDKKIFLGDIWTSEATYD